MTLFKDERTLRLDDLDITAAEAEALYRDLEPRIEDEALRSRVAAHAAAQADLLSRVDALRRDLGELPQLGDPERSQLGAAGAHLRAIVLPGDVAIHHVESLLEAAGKVTAQVDLALGVELDAELERLLTELRRLNVAFEEALRARL
jgi:hypothetical protein